VESGSQLSLLDESAFSNCPSLTSIFIPSSVGTLPRLCFSGCAALSSLACEVDRQLVGPEPRQRTNGDKTLLERRPVGLPLSLHRSLCQDL
jgi:hypothetical protein